jgi:superfamily II DNA or RNA helicase
MPASFARCGFERLGVPPPGQFLHRGYVDRSVVEVLVDHRHVFGQKPTVGTDRVPTERHGSGLRALLAQKGQGGVVSLLQGNRGGPNCLKQPGPSVHGDHDLIHTGKVLFARGDDQIGPFSNNFEFIVGDQRGDLNDHMLVRVQPSHFKIHPCQHPFTLGDDEPAPAVLPGELPCVNDVPRSTAPDPLSGYYPTMARAIRLRPWQRAALDELARHTSEGKPDFLAVATPGAGKTTFALAAATLSVAKLKREGINQRVVVCAPTAHLKLQWAQAATRFGLHLDPFWSSSSGQLPPDMHGIVTTYQQVSTSAAALRKLTVGAFVVLDEVHHAGDDHAWGDSVRTAFTPAAQRLCLSGTPFRSDTSSIPFVTYKIEEAVSDYEYGYSHALADGGVVRPVYFPRINGFMEWVAPDGTINAASFDDALDRQGSAQRLRTALSPQGEWIGPVLAQAHQQLTVIRQRHPEAGGLIIATDQEHANAIVKEMQWRLKLTPTLAVSDDPQASQKIAAFAASTEPWIVAVRMISEGVDIPRLAIGVYATTTTTELFFRQAVGRLVRWTASWGRRQKAYLFIPDDPRLRTWAFQIADARRHSLRKPAEDAADAFDGPMSVEQAAAELDKQLEEEQLSLFSALTATILDESHLGVFDDDYDELGALEEDAPHDHDVAGLDPLTLELADLLPPDGVALGRSRAEIKEELRLRNAEAARELVRFTGRGHAQVNSELNRISSVRTVDEATLEQLERRALKAEKWLADLKRIPTRR